MIEMTKPKEKTVSRGRVVWASFVTGWVATVVVLGVLTAIFHSTVLATGLIFAMFGPPLTFVAVVIVIIVVGLFVELWKWAYEDPSKDDER